MSLGVRPLRERTHLITQLTIDEIAKLVKSTPEQSVFDWKVDFTVPNDDEKRGEIIKDIAAIANAAALSYGFVVYGVDPRKHDPILGISKRYDDAKLQQLVKGKIEPPVDFVYYEVSAGPKIVGVIQVQPSRRRPHIITVDLGKVRNGQIVVRRGSSTDGINLQDLFEFFYGQTSGYFPQVIHKLKLDVEQQKAATLYMQELRQQQNDALKSMEVIAGLPPGTLGAKW